MSFNVIQETPKNIGNYHRWIHFLYELYYLVRVVVACAAFEHDYDIDYDSDCLEIHFSSASLNLKSFVFVPPVGSISVQTF